MTTGPKLKPFIHWKNPISGKYYFNKTAKKPNRVKPAMRPRDRARLQKHQMQPVSFEASKVVACADVQKRLFHPSEVVKGTKPHEFKMQSTLKAAA